MVTDSKDPLPNFPPRALIVGNFCHDFLIRDARVVTESLGGAASFISTVFDGLSVPYLTVSKVGADFAYSTNQTPIVVADSKTTTFRAFFGSSIAGDGHGDRILKRIAACAPILPSDLPDFRFDFGMAVGVGGEILPETLTRMLEICDAVFVDIQSLIRVFDEIDGTVEHVNLKESGFFHLLPRIGFLKASAEEAPFMDVEEVRKFCPVLVTNGKEGCTVYSNGGQLQIAPFTAAELDPTGAGDCFLGGFAAGFTAGLAVSDAALLGNLFGSLTVSQMGLPQFESRILQRIKDKVEMRKLQHIDSCDPGERKSIHQMPEGHEQFKKLLVTVRSECQLNVPASPRTVEQVNGQHKLL
ncbi:inositol 3-kinase-like [Cucurbita maxima]|uniref:Inositol 3-kinase-like n=1 Tax=Cucurbita maxima TaxID=3661 RepID=A0A6J1I3U1_CUCMA|nr:inositol 3-kinase-like [Cucurbita maxima]